VHTTQNHPFWNATAGAWTAAGNLLPGDELRTPAGTTVTVAGVIAWTETKLMLNLGVSDLHSYYVVIGGTPVLVHNRDPDDYWFSRPGYRNYRLVNWFGRTYYSGMYGPAETAADVQRRHAANHNRFNPLRGDRMVHEPGVRTYGEARLMEDRVARTEGTIIGRDGDNYRGNRQQPMDPSKRARYEDYESRIGGGGC
jgi:Pretoxin HINT domain